MRCCSSSEGNGTRDPAKNCLTKVGLRATVSSSEEVLAQIQERVEEIRLGGLWNDRGRSVPLPGCCSVKSEYANAPCCCSIQGNEQRACREKCAPMMRLGPPRKESRRFRL